tara:strand:+ start:5755 stop:5895 length:141 start_codon:yes stop_codon:yes gene_type:complete
LNQPYGAECFELDGGLNRKTLRWRLAGAVIKPPYTASGGNSGEVNG